MDKPYVHFSKRLSKVRLWQCFALEHLEMALSRGATLAHIARTLSHGQIVPAGVQQNP
jgi:hypothetical protein